MVAAARALDRVLLPLELPDVAGQRARRQEMAHQLDDYVVPRLQQIDAPLLAQARAIVARAD